VSALEDKIEKVYQMVVQSQQTGITISQIARQLEGDILAPHYVAQLILALRIKTTNKVIMGHLCYVASNIEYPAFVSQTTGKAEQ
jgi:hypothetical protein